MAPKFNIGDQVWRPTFEATEESVACPDCGGTGRLRVTFHDETTVSIECQNCSAGYQPPTGRVKRYVRRPEAHLATIYGIEMENGKVSYKLAAGLHSCWHVDEDDLTVDYDTAIAKAQALADKAAAEEDARIYRKERDTRTWAWNASYHRRCIKDAQRNLDYHTKKLSVAALKAKEKDDAPA